MKSLLLPFVYGLLCGFLLFRLVFFRLFQRVAQTAAELSSLFDRTMFAVSQEETRYYLNGIYMHEKGEGKDAILRAAATDGHRLAAAEVPLPEGAKGMAGIIVPKKTVGEVQKLVAVGLGVGDRR